MQLLSYQHLLSAIENLESVVARTQDKGSTHKSRLITTLNTFQPVQLTYTKTFAHIFTPNEITRQVLVESGGVSPVEATVPGFVFDDTQRKIVLDTMGDVEDLLRVDDGYAYRVSTLLVNSILWCRAKSGGGSLAQNLGLIWFSPKKHWTTEFYAENIFHEALHQALFIEDMTRGVFGDLASLKDERVQVTSNFLKVKRRFDLTFHGIFVATELAKWYAAIGNQTKARSFIPEMTNSLVEMDAAIELAQREGLFILTKHGMDMYNELKSYSRTLV